MYKLSYSDEAEQHMKLLKHREPNAFKKLAKLLVELMQHPTTGTGHPEPILPPPAFFLGDFYKSPQRGKTISNTIQAEGAVP